MSKENEVKALALYLGIDVSEISPVEYKYYGLNQYRVENGSKEFAVGSNQKAQTACLRNIKDSVWAFRAKFILEMCELPEELVPVFEAFQGEKCEDCNEAIYKLIKKTCGFLKFAQEAIRLDGRGHFLSSYDSRECSARITTAGPAPDFVTGSEVYFIYRTN